MSGMISMRKDRCERKKRVYVGGPVTGMPNDNHEAFALATYKEEKAGRIVFNPTTLPKGLEYGEYMTLCLPMLGMADELVLLPGWQDSKGAKAEHEVALCLGLVIRYPDGITSYPGRAFKVTA